MRCLIVGNGNVARAFRALVASVRDGTAFETCDLQAGRPGERVIVREHDRFDAVLNLSTAATGPLIDLCAQYGLDYLDASFEWRGDGRYSVADYAHELQDDLRPRPGILTLHGFGMNPGLVEVVPALYAPKRPYFALEVDTDTATAPTGAPPIWGTWSPETYFEETYLVPGAYSTPQAFLAPLPEDLHFGRRLAIGGRTYDFSATIHDETAYLVANDPNCRGAVFLYSAPEPLRSACAAARAGDGQAFAHVPVLGDLRGEERVGVAFWDGSGRIRYVANVADHARAFAAFGCNGTCWQVACGVYAGLCLLQTARRGESHTVSSAMRVPEYRDVILKALDRVGFAWRTFDNYLDPQQVRDVVLPIFANCVESRLLGVARAMDVS